MQENSSTSSEKGFARDRQAAVCERGIERCRSGDWQDGLVDLAWVAENSARGEVPSLCYSYLGYGFARQRGQVKEGIRLCKHAVKLEFFQPENYVNLARTALLSERFRYQAATAVLDGLEIDPSHPELLELQKQLGVRRAPVLHFLSRKHLLNRILGRFRHALTRNAPKKKRSS